MSSYVLNIKKHLGIIYWFITLLIFTLVGNNTGYSDELLLFHYSGTKWLIHSLFLIIYFFFFVVFVKKIYIDYAMIILLLKFLFDIFSTYIINTPASFCFILWADVGVFIYLICRNVKAKLDNVLNLYELFSIVLSIQTILTGILISRNGVSFQSVVFKSILRIPFASSNIIAGVVATAIISVTVRYEAKKTNLVLFVIKQGLLLTAFLFIRSRGSILLLLFVLDWVFFKKISSIRQNIKRALVYSLFILVNVLVLAYLLNSAIVEAYFSRYQDVGPSNDVTSGRVSIWKYSWDEFCKKPIWGRGTIYDSDVFSKFTGSHNIWLETLMNSGGIGFLFHVVVILYVINTIRTKIRNRRVFSKAERACGIIISFLYINSLFEESYYNYINDVLFWSLIGFFIQELSYMDRSYPFGEMLMK